MFLFYFEIVNKMRQVQLQFLNLPTASINRAGGAVLSLYDSLQPSVLKFCKI